MKRIRCKAEMLSVEDESDLIQRWQNNHDVRAFNRLLQAFQPLIQKHVTKNSSYGHEPDDLHNLAQLGFMRGLDKFDLKTGNRLATYVDWWIKAEVMKFIMTNNTIITTRFPNTKTKSIFFKIRRYKALNGIMDDFQPDTPEMVKVCKFFGCSEADIDRVQAMYRSVVSLNTRCYQSNGDTPTELIDAIEDETAFKVDDLIEQQEKTNKLNAIQNAVSEVLDDRERVIFSERIINDKYTLDDLGIQFKVSRERIRQVEAHALDKVKRYIAERHPELV